MADNLSISFLIGGGVSATLLNSSKQAKESINALGEAIGRLKASELAARKLQGLESSLDETRQKLKAATATTGKMAAALRSTAQPSNELKAAFAAASAESEKLKAKFRSQVGSIGKLRRELEAAGVDTKQLAAAQTQLATKLQATSAAQARLAGIQSARQANRQATNALYGQALEAGALAFGLQRALRPSIEFESAMADVAKVVEFDSTEALRGFGDELKALSRQIPLTAVELAEIAAEGGRLGLSADQLPDFVGIVSRMATAFDLLPSEAAEAIAKLSNIFEIPITDIERLGDAINQLANNTAAKEADIVNVLTRIGGTAKQFGLATTEAAALSDAFLALGRPPQVAATAINALLNRLQAAEAQGGRFQEGLASIGLSADSLAAEIKAGPQAALLRFLETLRGLDNQARAVVLTNLFGQEYADDLSILVGGLDEYRRALGLVSEETDYAGGVQREFEARSNTTANQLQLLLNTLNEVANNFGTAFLPAIRQVAAGLQVLSGFLADVINFAPDLIGTAGAVVAGFVAMRVAVLGVRLALTLLQGGFLSVAEGLAVLGARSALAGSAIEGTGAAATAAAAGVTKFSFTLGRLITLLSGGALVGVVTASVGGVLQLRDALNEAADALRSKRESAEQYRQGLQQTIAANAEFAELQYKTAEQQRALTDRERRDYEAALIGHEEYWRARTLLETDQLGAATKSTNARRKLALDELRTLTDTAKDIAGVHADLTAKVAAAKKAESLAIANAFAEQEKTYQAELKKLEEVKQARAAFNKAIAELTAPAAPAGDALIADTVLAPIRELQRANAALDAGNLKDAEAAAGRAVAQLGALKEAGKISNQFLGQLSSQASEIGRQVFDGLEAQQQAEIQKTKQALQSLINDAQLLKSIEIGVDQASALDSVEAIRKVLQDYLKANPIKVPVSANAPAPKADDLPGFSGGGRIFGPGTPTSDSVLMWGSRDEWVIRAAAARYYGDSFMAAINNMQLPKFADGGHVGGLTIPPIPRMPPVAAGAGASGVPLHLHIDGREYVAELPAQQAPDLARQLRRERLKRGGRP